MNDLSLFGKDLFGDDIMPEYRGPVADKFIFPPFSILDAKQGEWQNRKRAWIATGIKSEVGRDATAYNDHDWYIDKLGREPAKGGGVSIFDPVLCELIYRWFCPDGGQIIDPFAGGSVRGIIAGLLGYKYWGCDLSSQQITENKKQGEDIKPDPMPIWINGDSMDEMQYAPTGNLLFSCPPYGNLEVYSDDPADISNMDYHAFIAAYRRIILKSVTQLENNSFACFVVGDFRDKKGYYRNFVSETITAFDLCGAKLYNEAILATPIGSAGMRVTKQFNSGRKFAKTHQNVLVFCKGDWKLAAAKINDIELF
jgi:hypothetical protein